MILAIQIDSYFEKGILEPTPPQDTRFRGEAAESTGGEGGWGTKLPEPPTPLTLQLQSFVSSFDFMSNPTLLAFRSFHLWSSRPDMLDLKS